MLPGGRDPSIPSESNAYSETSTIPNTPEHPSWSDKYDDDFGRLVPANTNACIAFDELATRFRDDIFWNRHARRFVHIDEVKKDVEVLPSESDTDSEAVVERVSRWTGYYRLNLNIPPQNLGLGWAMGSGRRENELVDLLLVDKNRKYQVRGTHARITHDPRSNALLILTDSKRKIILNGTDEVEGAQRVIWKSETGITIGDLVYKLQLHEVDAYRYKEKLSELRKNAGYPAFEPPKSLDPTPSTYKFEYDDYILDKPFESGSTCTVSTATHKITGAAVAMKKIVRTARNSDKIKMEIEIMDLIGSHHRFCSLVGEIYTGGTKEGLGGNKVDEVYMIYSPLAEYSCYGLIKTMDLSPPDRDIFFKQWLEGISFLHGTGLMHRDINPNNLVVISRNPPQGRIIDLGAATSKKTSRDHMVGTIPFLAPEVIALKTSSRYPSYDNTVDIWAFGLTCYLLICQAPCDWKNIDFEVYEQIRKDLSSKPPSPIVALTERMLEWKPKDRITAVEALLHPAMIYVDVDNLNDVKPGEKRSGRANQGEFVGKKARED